VNTVQPKKPRFVSFVKRVRSWCFEHEVLVRSLVVYVVIVLTGLLCLLQIDKRDAAKFVATRALHAKHRLVADDIAEAGLWHRFLAPSLTTRDEFYGRYLDHSVDAGCEIDLDRTASGPQLVTPATSSVVWLPLKELPAADVASLDTGDDVVVCTGDKDKPCDAYRVEAVACPDKETGPACSAGVFMSDAQRKAVIAANDKKPTASPSAAPTPNTTASARPGATKNEDAASGAMPAIHVFIHHATPPPALPAGQASPKWH
jgi:hypothetical protein